MQRSQLVGQVSSQNGTRQQFNRALDLEELRSLPRPKGTDTFARSSISEHLLLPTIAKKRRESRPMASLKMTAARLLAHNVEAIPLQVLSQFQWSHIRSIWEVIEAELLDTLEVFVKFATAFPNDMRARKVLHVSLADLPTALRSIITRLYKAGEDKIILGDIPWALQLDLSHVPLDAEVLLQLGSIPGLSVLKINDSTINDSTINHWTRSQSAGGFAYLRLLDIRSNPIKNLSSCLEKLVNFPRLQMIRANTAKGWSAAISPMEEERHLRLWQDAECDKGAVIELKAHLGSKADRRPLLPAAEQVIIEVPAARMQLLAHLAGHTRPSAQENTSSRSKKRFKKMGASKDIWQQVLS